MIRLLTDMEHAVTFDLKAILDQHNDQALTLLSDYVNPAFAKVLKVIGYDVTYTKGQGAYLWDRAGNRYIDTLAGYGAFGLGRNHPVIRDALKQAMDADLPNLLKMGTPRLSGLLAKQLCELSPGLEKVFFCNSGAEAVETAMKFARAATGRARIVHCKKGFHGLTIGALSLNGNAEFRDGFGPLNEPVTGIPFNDLAALEAELLKGDVAAFIVEPIQGKGVNMPAADYLPGASALCKKHRALLVADEVQCGMGRTGKFFAVEHWGVEPDMICIAKSLSGGYIPVAATLSKNWIHKKVFSSLDRCVVHSTTFGQNDMAMVAGLATLQVMREEKLVENAAMVGERLKNRLAELKDKYEMVADVRGLGLMIAIEYGPPRSMMLKAGWKLIHAADGGLFPQAILIPLLQDHHILAQVAGHHIDVIKLIPPLTLTVEDADEIVAGFDAVTARCHQFPGPMWEIGKRLATHAVKGSSGSRQTVSS